MNRQGVCPFWFLDYVEEVRPSPKHDKFYDEADTGSGGRFGGSGRGESINSPWKSCFQIQSHWGLESQHMNLMGGGHNSIHNRRENWSPDGEKITPKTSMWKVTECRNNVPGRGSSKCNVSQANDTPVKRRSGQSQGERSGKKGQVVSWSVYSSTLARARTCRALETMTEHSRLYFICDKKWIRRVFFPHRKSTWPNLQFQITPWLWSEEYWGKYKQGNK